MSYLESMLWCYYICSSLPVHSSHYELVNDGSCDQQGHCTVVGISSLCHVIVILYVIIETVYRVNLCGIYCARACQMLVDCLVQLYKC